MKKLILICLLVCGVCGCNSTYTEFKAVEFIIVGAENTRYEKDGRVILLDVGQAGGELRFEATGKYAGNGFVSRILTDGMTDGPRYSTNLDHASVFPYVMFENEEMKVSILSENPHTTLVTLKENTQSGTKMHSLTFGGAYTVTDVTIFQGEK